VKKLFSILLLLLALTTIKANNIDSLKQAVYNMPDDSTKATVYYKIAIGIYRKEPDTMFVYATKALKLSEKLNIKTEIARSYHILGIYFAERGDLKRALEYFFKSLEILEKIGDKKRTGVAFGAIARVYQIMDNNNDALKYDLKALNISLEIKDSLNIATNYNNVGADYNNIGDFSLASENYRRALEIAKNTKNIRLQALLFMNIGYVYQEIDSINLALNNYYKSVGLYKKAKDNYGLAKIYSKLAGIHHKLNKTDSTIYYAKKAYKTGTKTKTISIIREASHFLNLAYKNILQFDSAYKYQEIYYVMKDSIDSKSNTKKLTQLEMQYNFDKERQINKIKYQAEVKSQKQITLIFIIAFISALLLVLVVFISYKKIKKAETKLKILNATKDKFFRIISHDLKGPFNAFISISELLANKNINLDKEKIQYFASTINKTAKSSYSLFQNLLMWSMSQRDNIKIEIKEINISEILNKTLEVLSPLISEKHLAIKTNIEINIIHSDVNIISTVLRNLISNSIKFTPENGEITINTYQKNDKTVISVSDTGVGIPENKIQNLLNPNYQETTIGTNNEKGTGLGLILCNELINKLNGKIIIKSKLKKGTTVSIVL